MAKEQPGTGQSDTDLLEQLVDRVAESVVEKLDEKRKIDLIAQAVLQRMRVQAPFREEKGEAPDGVPSTQNREDS